MLVNLWKVELKPEVEGQKKGEGENQQIAAKKKEFSLLRGGDREFHGLIYF